MELPKRKPTRLKTYDYSSDGYYFVTICSHQRKNIFSRIVGQGLAPAEVKLYTYGKIAERELQNLAKTYSHITINKYVIMPNHIHAIIIIKNKTAETCPCPTLSDVICTFKSLTTRKCHWINPNTKIWQTSFHDHIIRGDKDYLKIWEYIDSNPQKWTSDCFYVE